MGKSRNRGKSEIESLRGEIRSLKKELKYYKKREHFFEKLPVEEPRFETPNEENICSVCQEGQINIIDLHFLKLRICNSCGHKTKIKG